MVEKMFWLWSSDQRKPGALHCKTHYGDGDMAGGEDGRL